MECNMFGLTSVCYVYKKEKHSVFVDFFSLKNKILNLDRDSARYTLSSDVFAQRHYLSLDHFERLEESSERWSLNNCSHELYLLL